MGILFKGNIIIGCKNCVCFFFPGSPSSAINLSSTLTPTTMNSVAVRLDWDPPRNDGGVAITNYLIFVNMSQQVVSTDTTTTLTLNSTGEHLIEISAVNGCGLVGENVSTILITGNYKVESKLQQRASIHLAIVVARF